jgi:hypothetical protein
VHVFNSVSEGSYGYFDGDSLVSEAKKALDLLTHHISLELKVFIGPQRPFWPLVGLILIVGMERPKMVDTASGIPDP